MTVDTNMKAQTFQPKSNHSGFAVRPERLELCRGRQHRSLRNECMYEVWDSNIDRRT